MDRHRETLQGNPRMRYPLQSLKVKARAEVMQIRTRAERVRENVSLAAREGVRPE